MTQTIRVLIADAHPLILRGTHETLSGADDITLVGEATRSEEAQRLCAELCPDVLLLDLQMPGATATETVAYVREHCPETRVIILTAYDDAVYVRRMLAEGAMGYVLKDEAAEAVPTAIRSVIQGGTWLSRRVRERLAIQEFPQETPAAELYPTTRHRDALPIPPTTTHLTRQQLDREGAHFRRVCYSRRAAWWRRARRGWEYAATESPHRNRISPRAIGDYARCS